ncbi:sigma-70 family RNA polymerase sigma factor [Tenacibaculum aiptasiae]|uniref:Sigma-70 family RNA polymerase sigma factor n=1 Tax=Tenacibaculum aiptasiae TaxID=426481 RepID=A0A7J5AIF0_9FLAO|nr:sigma-70 family RNA polymerase sigma factor [Tenacibaculum aiptasiae]KAB1157346.1 sigma-70 family RNA polymerase sigma factor [Tenacibaculum aiptasiae]
MNLEEVIKNCKKKNREAQAILYNNYKDSLYSLSLKYCTNKEEAQDNLQDTFLYIFQNIKSYKNKGSFEGWMKRIAINKAIDRYKKSIQMAPIENYSFKNEDVFIENINEIPLSIILKFIQKLPNQYRLVFNLYELDNFSHNDISNMLTISVGTSKSNLFRAKKILKGNIQQYITQTKVHG